MLLGHCLITLLLLSASPVAHQLSCVRMWCRVQQVQRELVWV